MRCTLHPAYEANYCPRCGTATVIPTTADEIIADFETRIGAATTVEEREDLYRAMAAFLDETGSTSISLLLLAVPVVFFLVVVLPFLSTLSTAAHAASL